MYKVKQPFTGHLQVRSSGLMVSMLDSRSNGPGKVQVLAGVIELCSWARQFTLIVPHSAQLYKWTPAN